jgi:hypothetical protein
VPSKFTLLVTRHRRERIIRGIASLPDDLVRLLRTFLQRTIPDSAQVATRNTATSVNGHDGARKRRGRPLVRIVRLMRAFSGDPYHAYHAYQAYFRGTLLTRPREQQ